MKAAELTIQELRKAYQSSDLSPSEAIRSIAESIDEVDSDIGGYLSYDLDQALADAEKADLSLPLGGVPIAIKDLINVNGHPCGCASKLLTGAYTAPYDATIIRKLREAGAIPFGRTNMDEFAMGSTNQNSGIKPCVNPHDKSRVPGGSSGGSAAVVAANTAVAAIGTDTGGSIRQPAGLCGIVGLKPSYGRVSRYGLTAFASSLDQAGPMTKTVADSALLLEAMAGSCELDSTCLDRPVGSYTKALENTDLSGVKVGIPKEYFAFGLDPAIESEVRAGISRLEAAGAELVEVEMPHTEYAVATYYVLATAEASGNLARFDGVRYGNRAESEDLLGVYTKSRAQGFGSEVKRRILLGTYVLSSGYYDAYYHRAQKVRTLIRQDFEKAFEKVDVLASPVNPLPAFKVGENSDDPVANYLADIYTISANLAGVCGISVPCGATEVEGSSLPVGLQLVGPAFGEKELLRIAHAFETSV